MSIDDWTGCSMTAAQFGIVKPLIAAEAREQAQNYQDIYGFTDISVANIVVGGRTLVYTDFLN